ncbi:hypothetical protein NPIL_100071 [Nephila pilipes]|uniref:Uncharacterized protein n=1 Tax=Nephila pilipes TaxID=299642 RepID=A0A8X6NQY1_NEPPI|nr:hypothetical protein NPIL_100071 [Nephila pilipes]
MQLAKSSFGDLKMMISILMTKSIENRQKDQRYGLERSTFEEDPCQTQSVLEENSCQTQSVLEEDPCQTQSDWLHEILPNQAFRNVYMQLV